jgi:acyl-CoA synthetase (AMP-forming)/AMP-acid ligase II
MYSAENFTADGFFRTGDIGVADGSGKIRVIDRCVFLCSTLCVVVTVNQEEERLQDGARRVRRTRASGAAVH